VVDHAAEELDGWRGREWGVVGEEDVDREWMERVR
jgi:hypothetical protein